MALGIIGIVVALAIFLYGAYKNVSVLYLAPLCGIIVAVTNTLTMTSYDFVAGQIITNPVSITEAFTALHIGSVDFAQQGEAMTYSIGGVLGMLSATFPTVFLGALFGKVLASCGAAASIASTLSQKLVMTQKDQTKQVKRVILCMLLIEVIMTYGGVDGFVTVFATFPIAMFLSEKAGIPRRMIPAILMLSCGANSAPFVLSINNIISMSVLHTSPGAAAIPGFICFIVIEVGVYLICVKCTLSAIKKGETFEKGNVHLPAMDMSAEKPSMVLSLIPLIVVFILFATVGNASLALVVGILVAVILMHKYIPASGEASASGVGAFMGKVIGTLNDGAGQGASAVMTLSAAAGFAAVVQHTQAFNAFVGIIFGLPLPPLVLALILMAVIVAFTSSPPAALGVALPMIAGAFIWSMPEAPLINPDALARVAAITVSTFETLPVNGMILLTTSIAGVKVKDAYLPQFLQSVIMTLIGAILCTILCLAFPGIV